ncbi:MAG: hypothetical protein KDI90_12475 [Alphaproteobacteria bacterium]|nr:hypothetical protein [Alphaproteobacteria bacterium]MCB9975021.1 hypothetical protein [Rhodospirillales bacterium]
MREFGDWFRKSAEAAGERLGGRKSVKPSVPEKGADSSDVTASGGGGLSNVELVTGSAGTGVRSGDECEYDSFRPGGRDIG